MSLELVLKILKESPLDKETKLFVIDLIAYSDDERFVEDLMNLILSWKKMDMESISVLHDALFQLTADFNQKKETSKATLHKNELTLADEIAREEKIQKIRDHLMTI